MFRSLTAAIGFFAISSATHAAHAAPSKARQCIATSEAAIALTREGKLLAAREKFAECAAAACPAPVHAACDEQLQQAVAATPSISFDAKDGSGHDLGSVMVAIDEKLPVKLTGLPIELDPGEHRFTFSVADQSPVALTFVLSANNKGRRERITIGAPPPEKVVASPSALPLTLTPAEATDGKSSGTQSKTRLVLGITSGALGVAGLSIGTAFGLMAFSEKSRQNASGCTATSCNQSQQAQSASARSNGTTDATLSTVGFVAGGVLVAAGAVILLTAPRGTEPHPTAGLVVVPGIGPNGGGMLLRGEF